MYLTSLHGHGTSLMPGLSGKPTECRQGTKSALRLIISATAASPILVMIRMLAAT